VREAFAKFIELVFSVFRNVVVNIAVAHSEIYGPSHYNEDEEGLRQNTRIEKKCFHSLYLFQHFFGCLFAKCPAPLLSGECKTKHKDAMHGACDTKHASAAEAVKSQQPSQ
jgi:hypothetical protein